ncbi:hypothetical protein ACXJJ3_17940 [Kribbella sp. WER1]
MTDLDFNADELTKFSGIVHDIKVPGFADESGPDLGNGIRGSDVAVTKYAAVAGAAEFYLDRARRGLEAFGQVTRDIAQQFGDTDRVNADALQKAWTDEHGPLLGNRNADTPPPLPAEPDPAKPANSVPPEIQQQIIDGYEGKPVR